ncbi:hypothetical protein SDC9_156389 [bioreactor metagenome]|uniref:Uncharacterized protein n=1 Tax=bioreactor metagenome TaxID=1076179 RepID=A0A645F4A6_9ZZZZ
MAEEGDQGTNGGGGGLGGPALAGHRHMDAEVVGTENGGVLRIAHADAHRLMLLCIGKTAQDRLCGPAGALSDHQRPLIDSLMVIAFKLIGFHGETAKPCQSLYGVDDAVADKPGVSAAQQHHRVEGSFLKCLGDLFQLGSSRLEGAHQGFRLVDQLCIGGIDALQAMDITGRIEGRLLGFCLRPWHGFIFHG